MSFVITNFEPSENTFSETESSVSIVKKPPTVKEACTVRNQTKRLPVIKEPRKAEKNLLCVFEKSKATSKPLVSFPKLIHTFEQTETVPRADAGEPYSNFLPSYYTERLDSNVSGNESPIDESLPWDYDSTNSSLRELENKDFPSKPNISSANLKEIIKNLEAEDNLEESHALKRWKYWLEDKTKIQNYLSKKLNRKPNELLIQDPDRYRETIQKKALYTMYPTLEKSRGPVTHWKPQRNMSKKKSKMEHHHSQSKTKINEKELEEKIRQMDYIGTPKVIKMEKKFEIPENRKDKKYLKNEEETKDEELIQNLLAIEREKEDLAIVGTQINKPQEETESLVSIINLPDIVTISTETLNSSNNRKSVFCLVIADEEIRYDIEINKDQESSENLGESERNFTWEVDFGVNATRTIAEKVLRIENRGTVAVRYDWFSAETEQTKSLGSLQPIRHEPWFFFNKNSGVFIPGQIYDLKIYHWAKFPGVRKETWHIKTYPPLSENKDFGTFFISAIATDEILTTSKTLESYLHKRMSESFASFMIKILLEKVFRNSDIIGVDYPSILTERDLFEHHNPKYYYHCSIVKELKKLFKELENKTQLEWDLSLDTLMDIVISVKTGAEKNDILQEIAKTAKRLFRPNYFLTKNNKKYKMVYGILCKAANSVETDYNLLKYLIFKDIQSPLKKPESEEKNSKSSERTEENDESNVWLGESMTDIKPTDLLLFKSLFYSKVHQLLCDAVESIAGVLETGKLFEPWKQVSYKMAKPAKNFQNILER